MPGFTDILASVDGKTYTSQHIAFRDLTSDYESNAERIIRRFPAGSDIIVLYAPGDPARSVLIPGVPVSAFVGVGIGLLFTLVGGLLCAFIVRYYLHQRARAHAAGYA